MSVPTTPDGYDEPSRTRVNAGQVWSAGLATAVIAALVAVVGILISRWILHIPILAPSHAGAWGNANTAYYALAAACVALVATAILYLLMLGTPAPTMFLSWILGLATVAAVVYPFSTSAPVAQKAATAIVNLVLGIAISSLLNGVAARGYRASRSGLPRNVPPGAAPPRDVPPQRYPEDGYAERQYPQYRRGPAADPTEPMRTPRDWPGPN